MPKAETQFRPGTSGNPGGRPKDAQKANQTARKYVLNALYAIIQLACDESAPAAVRYRSGRFIIRLGFGPSTTVGRQVLAEFGWEGVRRRLAQLEREDIAKNGSAATTRLGKDQATRKILNVFTR